VGGCTTRPNVAPGRRAAKEPVIFDLSLTERVRYRPFHLVSPAFVEERRLDTRVDDLVLGGVPPAPFAAVELRVDGLDGTLVAGLAADDGDRLVGTYDDRAGRVTIELRTGGRTAVLRRRSVRLPDAFGFAVALCENQLTVLADTGDGWRPLLTERKRVRARIDLRDPATLARHRYAWGVRKGGARLRTVTAGLFGMTGLRDPHLVQHADGRPYVADGKVYLTFTCAGLGFFQQAHWGVFTLDLEDPTDLQQVAQLYTRRDGLLLGDHAGQLVRDDEADRWLVATSSWGDFDFEGVHARHVTTEADLLTGVHLLETERTALPTEVSSWDPGMTRIDGHWYVSFVESPSQRPFDFHPALARGDASSPWHDDLARVGAATDLHQCEGPVLARVGGRWWLLASDGDHRTYPVFTLDMHRVGRLDAPYPTNIPHPTLLDRGDGRWWMVTFDGTQYAQKTMGYGGHGDVVILEGSA
jgi:hypothetical protein